MLPVSQSIFERCRCSYGHFFAKKYLNVQKHQKVAREIIIQNRDENSIFEYRLTQKLSVAAEERLKNNFRHRERVQAV